METIPAKDSILTKLFNGQFTPNELRDCRTEMGEKVFQEEDSIDGLTHLWKYTRACIQAPLSSSAPPELNVFILLYLASCNEGVELYFRNDYLAQPEANPTFFSKFMEIVVWVFTDYQNSDPVLYSNWITSYETIRNTWLTHTIPQSSELKSVCTIAEKLTRKPTKRKSTNRKPGAAKRQRAKKKKE